jgi:flagellin
MISLNTNLASINAQISLSRNQNMVNKTMAQLSSGLRITTAADDPSGMGVATQFTNQVNSYNVATQNANAGVSLLQTADGALGQITGALQRMRELAMESANGTLASVDRVNIQTEFAQLQSEISRVAASTRFGSVQILNAATTVQLQVGINNVANVDTINLTLKAEDATTLKVDGASINVGDTTSTNAALTSIDTAIASISADRANIGAVQNRVTVAMTNDQSAATNLSSALSQIQDVNVAQASGDLAREQVLVQAGVAVLAQANQQPQAVLSLLR